MHVTKNDLIFAVDLTMSGAISKIGVLTSIMVALKFTLLIVILP